MPTALPLRRSDIPPLPLALAVVLAVTLGVQLARRPDPVVVDAFFTPPRRTVVSRVSPPPDYPAIEARALFSPTRGAVAEATGQAAAPTLDSYALLGTAFGNGRALAMLRGPAGVVDVRPGDSIAGWRLIAVRRDTVLLEQRGVRRSLTVGAAAGPVTP